jgi:hypothetical protein
MHLPELIQAATVRLPENTAVVAWVLGVLQAVIVALLTAGLRLLRSMNRALGDNTREIAKHAHDLYGPNGRNGLRGDVSGLKRGHARHDRELEVLCRDASLDRAVDP